MEVKSLWHLNAGQSAIRSHLLQKPDHEHCVVQSHFSMVSLGTERLVARGGVPSSLYEVMRVPYMQGNFDFPLSYGYSISGKVVEGPEEWMGKRVHAMHPHQTFCRVATLDLTVIPSSVPMDRAVFASNLETAVNALWDANPLMGQKILVIGFGLIGGLIAWLARQIPGAEVVVHEVNEQRAQFAQHLGFTLFEKGINGDVDLVFHTSATQEGLQFGLDQLRQDGTCIEMSWYGNRPVTLALGSSFHYKRQRIISSQVSQIASPARGSWDFKRRKELVFTLLANPFLDHFLGKAVPFASSDSFFNKLREEDLAEINAYFYYDQD